MIAGAADLVGRLGVNATSMREVVRYTETPRGSIAFHFPGGKVELVQDPIFAAPAD
jgi:AcrR family transcriptional regulator